MKRMRLLLAAVCIVGGFQSAYCQAEISMGIKGGVNFSNLKRESVFGETYDNITGLHGGLYTLFKFGKIGLQPEVLFSRQGSSSKAAGESLTTQLNFINVPVIIKVYTIGGINLQFGPQIGFLTGANGVVTVNGIPYNSGLNSVYNKNDFSLAMGLGWESRFGLSIDARYNMGLTNINDGTNNLTPTKNQVLQISAGYRLYKFGR